MSIRPCSIDTGSDVCRDTLYLSADCACVLCAADPAERGAQRVALGGVWCAAGPAGVNTAQWGGGRGPGGGLVCGAGLAEEPAAGGVVAAGVDGRGGLRGDCPWTVRNYVVSHSFVLVATGDGTVLRGAYNDYVLTIPAVLGGWYSPAYAVKKSAQTQSIDHCSAPCEVVSQAAETGQAIQWIKNHPYDMPILMVLHVKSFFTPYTNEADMPLARFDNQLSTKIVARMAKTVPFLIFAAAGLGLVVTRKRYWKELLFAYLVILGTLGEILVFYGNSRFRTPIEPLLLLLGAGALWWLTEAHPEILRFWQRRQRHETDKAKNTLDI